LEIIRIVEGIQIDSSDEHLSNAEFPRVDIFEPDSNVTFESFAHPLKQATEIVSTDAGITTDWSSEQFSNAD
jgi:hypothetical protein